MAAQVSGADPSSSRPRWPAIIIALCLALAALAFDPGVPIEAQGNGSDNTTDLPVGVPVAYEVLDGSESLALTIAEIIDPFEEGLRPRDESRLSEEARRLVALRLRIENTASTDLKRFHPRGIRLLDTDTVLYAPTFVGRGGEASAADPKLPTGDIPAGAIIEGLLFYELPEASQVEAVLFAPSNDRLITLSSRGVQPDLAVSAAAEAQTTVAQAPTPVQPDLADLDSNGSYDSAYFGHRVRWDPDHWRAVAASSSPDHVHLALEGEVVGIEIDGLRDLDGDAHRCLVDQVYEDLDEIVGFDAPPDDVKPPTEDGRLPADAGLYLMTPDEDGQPRELVRYVECRTLLTDDAVLRVVITAPERYWAADWGLVAEVLSAIEMPVWSPQTATADSLAEPSSAPPTVAREVAPLDCGALLRAADVDHALAVWERVHAGEDGDTLGRSGGEVCTEQIASDEAMLVRIEPGQPGDLDPGAELLGVEGRPIPAFGDEAMLFHAQDADAAGQSVLSVAERRDVGPLHMRLTLGRPDLEAPERALILAKLAREVLPRFPGSRVQAQAVSFMDELGFGLAGDDGDRSHLTYVDNLLAKEEAGEWTRGEGLVATLKLFAGEAAAEDVLRHGTTLDWEGTGILSRAARFLEEGAGDTKEETEIAWLLDLLTYDDEELEAMAGIAPSSPATALQPHPTGAGTGVASHDIALRLTSVRSAQAPIEDCLEFFGQSASASTLGIGPCLEWRPANVPGPGLEAGKYRIFIPAAPLPQAGWTEKNYDMALRALEHSARWFEDEGSRLAKGAGAFGGMPRVNVVFSVIEHPGRLADATQPVGKSCGIRLYTGMQGLSVAHFQQIVAHELAHCHQWRNFFDQALIEHHDWWVEGSAEYLSNVIYDTANFEHKRWSWAKGINLKTTLLDLSYGAYVFFQFLEQEMGIEGVYRLFGSLPIKGGKREQEASLRQFHGATDELYQDFLEALVDGTVRDTGGGFVPTPLTLPHVVLHSPMRDTQDIKPFGASRLHLIVQECKRARMQLVESTIGSSARPAVWAPWQDGWATGATTLPAGPGDERDRILAISAVEAAQIDFEVTDVDDDPECEPDDPLAPSSVVDEFCDLGCEPSDYFPPLSPRVDVSDS